MALGQFGLTQNGSASDLTITQSTSPIVCTAITGLVGMRSFGLQYRFVYGSAGTSVRAYLQTSLDGGNTWFDLACRLFTNANAIGLLNFTDSQKLVELVPTDGSMIDNTAIDGPLGDRLRYKVAVVGTYAGNTLFAARVVAR